MAAAAPDPEAARRALNPFLAERARLESMLGDAIDAFVAARTEQAASGARAVLSVQPDNSKAAEVVRVAEAVLRGELSQRELLSKRLLLGSWLEDSRGYGNLDLDHQLLRWPSAKFWEELAPARHVWVNAKWKGGGVFVRKFVESVRVSLVADNEPLESVARRLRVATAIDIVFASSALDRARKHVVRHLDVHDWTLSAVLDAITADGDFVWTIERRRVRISDRAAAGVGTASARMRLATHAVHDLVEYPERPAVPEGERRKPPAFPSAQALADAIRADVHPEVWTNSSESRIVVQGSVSLVVNATQYVHDDLADWLTAHRRP